jgi:uncharacterized RDD family membrane protein YckC
MRSAALVEPEGPRYASARPPSTPAAGHDEFWRQEVISRVQQHRARRRKRSDSDGSMEFDFPVERSEAERSEEMSEPVFPADPVVPAPAWPRLDPPKIIHFPRSVTVQSVPLAPYDAVEELELAEPVIDAPRILDAPEPPAEQMDLLPTFEDIRLDAEEPRRSKGLDLPLHAASLQQRFFAGMVDAGMVLIASAVLVTTFLALSNGLPQARMVLLCACMTGSTLWLLYQYIFLVYAAGTPGMQMAQLELCTFDGQPVSVTMRRWRAVASMLSGCSIGLGFAWALVDEDTLGWHDRITQTHLRSVGPG